MTAARAYYVKPAMGGSFEPIGSITLNRSVGGLSPRAVQAAFRHGARVFMPTTHANWSLSRPTLENQRALIARGAFIEYVAVSLVSPVFYEQDVKELAAWMKELGPEQLVLASDLGQMSSPPPPEGLRMLVAALLQHGVPYESLETMLKINPARLLNLQAD